MNFKSCLISGVVALIAGTLAGYWLCNLQLEAKDARTNESQAKEETRRLEKAIEENRNLHEMVSQMQTKAKKENENAKREYDTLLARINRGTIRVSVPASACIDVSNTGHSEKREPNLTQRLLNEFYLSDGTETPQSGI